MVKDALLADTRLTWFKNVARESVTSKFFHSLLSSVLTPIGIMWELLPATS